MKRITLIIRQREISRVFPDDFRLQLEGNASVLDAIKAVNKEIQKKCERFPVKGVRVCFIWFIIRLKKVLQAGCNPSTHKVATTFGHKGKSKDALTRRNDNNFSPRRRMPNRLGGTCEITKRSKKYVLKLTL